MKWRVALFTVHDHRQLEALNVPMLARNLADAALGHELVVLAFDRLWCYWF